MDLVRQMFTEEFTIGSGKTNESNCMVYNDTYLNPLKELVDLSNEERIEVFGVAELGDILRTYNYLRICAKLADYTKYKNIEVGNCVHLRGTELKAVCTAVLNDAGDIAVLTEDGLVFPKVSRKDYSKLDKHIDLSYVFNMLKSN